MNEDGMDATLRDYVFVVRRRKWLVLSTAIVLTALALAYSFMKTPMYRASAQLIYETELNVADPLSTGGYVDPSQMQVELNSVAVAITSPEIIQSAKGSLDADIPMTEYTISSALGVATGGADSSTVSITAEGPDPSIAARVANAYALAFTAARKSREQARVRRAQEVIQRELDSFGTAAERASAEYLTLQQRLQDLKILEATVTGNFSIIVPATAPKAPFSPQPLRNGLVGLVAGLILGVALALVLEQFDTRVRNVDEAAAIFAMPVLTHIRKVPSKQLDQQPLYVLGDSRSQAAEAVRKLRSNLEFANVDDSLSSLLITSSLQHEGKTLTACNLAISLAAAGKRVVLVDGDLRSPQVHRYLRLNNAVGLSTVLTGRSTLRRTLSSRTVGPSLTTVSVAGDSDASAASEPTLQVLTSGPVPPNPAEIIASKSFGSLMDHLRGDFDLVIVDTPALLAVGDTAAIARCVDGLIFLVDVTQARRPLLKEAAAQVSQIPCRKLGLVAISATASRRSEYEQYAYYSHSDAALGSDSARVDTNVSLRT